MAAEPIGHRQRYSPRLLRVAILSTEQATLDPSYEAAGAVAACLCQAGKRVSPFLQLEAAPTQEFHLIFALDGIFSILPTLQQSPHD